MIDTAKAKVRFAMEHFVDSQFYAVYGSSRTLPGLYIFKRIYFMKTKWRSNGNGVPHSRLGLIGRDHHNFPKIFNLLHQIVKAWSRNSIIIGNEYDSGFFDLNSRVARRFLFFIYTLRFLF